MVSARMDDSASGSAVEERVPKIESDSLEEEEELIKDTKAGVKTRSKRNPEYNLRKRTIFTRIQTEKKRKEPKQPKPKIAPAPLSKYRRKTANARERERMQDINSAFEELQQVIPNIEQGKGNKMTKVTTLRLAMNYISALRQTLGYDDYGSPGSSLSSDSCDLARLNSVGDSSESDISNSCPHSDAPSSQSDISNNRPHSVCSSSQPDISSNTGHVSSAVDLISDGDSVRSSIVSSSSLSSSSSDEQTCSPLDGDILQASFSAEELDFMCSDVTETIAGMCH